MPDELPEARPAEDASERARREKVQLEYETLMTSLLVERYRPTPKREPDPAPAAGRTYRRPT